MGFSIKNYAQGRPLRGVQIQTDPK